MCHLENLTTLLALVCRVWSPTPPAGSEWYSPVNSAQCGLGELRGRTIHSEQRKQRDTEMPSREHHTREHTTKHTFICSWIYSVFFKYQEL